MNMDNFVPGEEENDCKCNDNASTCSFESCPIEDVDYGMGESLESNFTTYTGVEQKENKGIAPFACSMACVIMVLIVISSASGLLASFQDRDEFLLQVKQFTRDVKQENEAFKTQLVSEVHEKIFLDLATRINDLKAESEKLNGVLHQIVSKGTIPYMSASDIEFGNSTADTLDKLKALFMKDTAILTLKICTAFIMLLGLCKLLWGYLYGLRNKLPILKTFADTIDLHRNGSKNQVLKTLEEQFNELKRKNVKINNDLKNVVLRSMTISVESLKEKGITLSQNRMFLQHVRNTLSEIESE